eukprot:765450-Hanusia_phi.AAC.3
MQPISSSCGDHDDKIVASAVIYEPSRTGHCFTGTSVRILSAYARVSLAASDLIDFPIHALRSNCCMPGQSNLFIHSCFHLLLWLMSPPILHFRFDFPKDVISLSWLITCT